MRPRLVPRPVAEWLLLAGSRTSCGIGSNLYRLIKVRPDGGGFRTALLMVFLPEKSADLRLEQMMVFTGKRTESENGLTTAFFSGLQ